MIGRVVQALPNNTSYFSIKAAPLRGGGPGVSAEPLAEYPRGASPVADPPQPENPGRLRSTNALRDGDLSPSPGAPPDQSTHRVFVSDEALLDVSFTAAQARLTHLIRGGVLGTIRAFLHHITEAILYPARAAGPGAAADPDPPWLPTEPETP